MDAVVVLALLPGDEWFSELQKGLGKQEYLCRVQLTQLEPPLGGLGAGNRNKFKVTLKEAAELAGVLSLIVALYESILHEPNSISCQVKMTNRVETIEMTIPCSSSSSSTNEFDDIVKKLFDKLVLEPSKILVTPTRHKPKHVKQEHG